MKKLFSMFIMDVTNSTEFENSTELTEYLSFWENTLNDMSFLNIKAKHRMGDEIICVADNFYSAVMIAYYIIYNWKYEKFMPYFGITIGEMEGEIENVDKWNHPVIKKAREANEKIKKDDERKSLFFLELPSDLLFEKSLDLNMIISLQTMLILGQTSKQREILGLYSLVNSQKKVAEILGKTPPTISNHIKKGYIEMILQASGVILESLKSGQVKKVASQSGDSGDFSELISQEYNNHNEQIKTHLLHKIWGG
ncbi:hypothetical protein SAMN05443252_1146 [Bacillus sp. OV322]|uniref:hypothetical protein n=1 Tax=Bacillus sp. OV322 TaxID=1882764 RepID=UPI0008DFECD4|nr:hypothetical protein [Bacillus sp. OV322]SFD02152.1 hypothetical protein SAMN05443252_1146 [Bacillus sp. OV322]